MREISHEPRKVQALAIGRQMSILIILTLTIYSSCYLKEKLANSSSWLQANTRQSQGKHSLATPHVMAKGLGPKRTASSAIASG